MGYKETSGLVLRRRDVFEDDQMLDLLTPEGCLTVRAPHARRSQKTFCGRLEPPNAITTRLYQSKEHSRWIVSSIELEEVFADLIRDRSLRIHLIPAMSRFVDVFPAGESPGSCLPHFKKGLQYLKQSFQPVALVTNRILTKVAERTGVAFEVSSCGECKKVFDHESASPAPALSPESGLLCSSCRENRPENATSWTLNSKSVGLYRDLLESPWEEVRNKAIGQSALSQLEEVLYRLFHYHFEISLDTLEVRKRL